MMKYRSFPGMPGSVISALGFGLMRLPVLEDGKTLDEAKVTELTKIALDQGINYFDTAWPYHNEQSEACMGRVIKALGARERVQIATKSPCWLVKEEADWERFIDLQLERLQVQRIDYYLFHAVDAGRWEQIKAMKGLAALERAKAAGKIGHIGFSFHDAYPVFEEVLKGYGWEFCQLQYNYFDQDAQAGKPGVELATARNVGIIVMEPLRGGGLARNIPKEVREAFAGYPVPRMPAEWSLRWILDHPGVVTVLSGMGKPEELLENAAVASSQDALTMSEAEKAVVEKARRAFSAKVAVPCTKCNYCQPCPAGVAIPEIFSLRNNGAIFGDFGGPRWAYGSGLLSRGAGADKCVKCGACEEACPQKIPIMAALEEAHAKLTSRD